MPTLRPAASFWTAALVLVLTQWAGAAPSVVYPLYAARWGLTAEATTMLFAASPLALVVVLALFGGVSDHLGRRASMLVGTGFLVVGGLVFAAASDVAWLFVGRGLQGIGTGFALGAASAALVDVDPTGNPARASSVSTLASAVGIVAAMVVGGALAQHAPWPTHLTFWVLLALFVLAFTLTWFMPHVLPRHGPHDPDVAAGNPWRPRPIGVPRGSGRLFAVAALALVAAFGTGAIILSLGATIARDLIGTADVFVQGLVLGLSAAVIGVVGLVFRPQPPRRSVVLAGLCCAAATLLLVPAATAHSMALFVAALLLGGATVGFGTLGGVGLVHRDAPEAHRGLLLSAIYLVGYVAQGASAVLAGLTATAVGLARTVDDFAVALTAVGLLTATVALTGSRTRPRASEPATTLAVD